MPHINKKWLRTIDSVIVILSLFVVSLIFLFAYGQQVNNKVQAYYDYKQSVITLHGYNLDYENILSERYKYIDYDLSGQVSMKFDKEIAFLTNNESSQNLNTEIKHLTEQIESLHTDKISIIENFKTLNARISNAAYYLYELQVIIENGRYKNKQLEALVRDILFKVGQIFAGKDLETLAFKSSLNSLRLFIQTDADIKRFYKHVNVLVQDIASLQMLLDENTKLNLSQTIDEINSALDSQYKNDLQKIQRLEALFFVLALTILLLLINTYLKVQKSRSKIEYIAYHDTLTGLVNRHELEHHIDRLINRFTYNSGKPFSLLFIDLDRFKVINDTLGHDVGDEMLLIVAQRIENILDNDTLFARLGGDEFVIIIDENEHVIDIAKKINREVRRSIDIREYHLHITASIGIASYPNDGENKSELLRHADSAMYYAKEKGRDTYAFYDKQLSVEIDRRLVLEQSLANGLQNNEFSLVFQPQYNLISKKIIGVECLVRWKSHILGQVSPDEFIPVAEETGLIVSLGDYIFEEACRNYMYWRSKGIDVELISINMSAIQLQQEDAFMKFKEIIHKTGMDAKFIEIELTERYIMEYAKGSMTILNDLRAIGCKVAIDDFGTGYSSMSYLKSLEIDTVKIDKSFVVDLPDSHHDAAVSKAIIVLSQSLGYKVIAEGIETEEQESLLKTYNCDMGQGYYFAKPMPSNDFVVFYKKKENFKYS